MWKWIPNLMTAGNLVLGVLALLLAYEHRASDAALMVVIGMVVDGLDGRAARFFRAESDFGRELDSLADIVTFGVAPALIMWNVTLQSDGWVGVAIAVLFPVCGALRLARFNLSRRKTHYFVGLPITAAGGILASLALYRSLLAAQTIVLPVAMVVLAVLMVSRARYPNFKRIAFPRSTVVVVPMLAILVFLLFHYRIAWANRLIFAPLILYAIYGGGQLLRRRRRKSVDAEGDAKPIKHGLK